ncbi:NAD-dependent epimerase/dehydratase family protein [Geomonas sp. RF6]|uniref:NAD-dependent epimerase/dehydratase family protein n=1 Tax=Geomonas sp. RF6 TaxID=2897342 RepID=UPI001E43E53E|nr:NAD-dependent epimerase/dehydratase family protein [Geomonas sp. RF6]UFS71044.1 NAD-dependent epimerase/dehydratase family protein [Geomonas sp. RF6]
MNILIIGGAGFLGANMVRRCLKEPGVRVTVLDSLDPHLHASTRTLSEVWDRIRFVRGDIRDETLLAEIVQGQDVIFNCAAQTSHPLSIQYPLLDAEINCLGNLKLLESIRLLNRKARVVYTSSSTVIGKALTEVVDEDHWERPLEIYSANKGVAEKYYRIYHTLHDLDTVVLRFANLYGAYGKGHPEFGFINYFIQLAWAGEEIKIFGSGEQMRNVLFADDAVEILWRAAHAPALVGESWFATGDEHLSVAEIARKIVEIFGRGRVTHVEWPEERKRIEIDHVLFSSDRLRSMVEWHPGHTMETGLHLVKEILERQERGRR